MTFNQFLLFSFSADVLCDPSNTDQWGTLCAALKEADLFQTLGATTGSFTIFAPSNDAFASLGDYALDVLFQNQKQLQSLISVHIAPLIIPYAALLCNLNTEMLNFDVTYTLCIGGMKFQAADGNEISNLPIIDEPEDIRTKNGIIHAVNNIILPFQFSIDDIIEDSSHDAVISEGSVVNDENATELVEDIGESNEDDFIDYNNNATVTPSIIGEDVFESNYNSSDIVTDDDIEGNNDDFFDAGNSSIAISTSPLSSVMNILADSIADRTESCKVCENREMCAIPRTAVMMVPGEGEERCTDVIDRQNKGRGIMMGPNMCKALQERFQYSCLDENKPSSEEDD